MQKQAHSPGAELVLTVEQQYRSALSTFPQLDREQEQAFIQRAQTGENVRDVLILSVQSRVYTLAARYQRRDKAVERMDLVQAANDAMLRRFSQALLKDNPITYLLRVAQLAMIDCINGRSDLIKTHCPKDNVAVLSLDQPIGKDGTSLADSLAEDLCLQPGYTPKEAFVLLCQAIEALPEKQRLVIQRHYGLTAQPESLNIISRSLAPHSPRPANAHYHNKRALASLRKQLAPQMPRCVGGVQ